jgi:phosphatidate cytidylyltransferase
VRSLAIRVLSAAVLAPVFLGAVYLGGGWVVLVVLLGGAAMAYEWARLTAVRRVVASEALAVLTLVFAVLLWPAGAAVTALGVLAAGSLLASLAGAPSLRAGWRIGSGLLYVGLACLGFLWLRAQPEFGLWLILWLVAAVWATDIGAYAIGKAFGGPLMARRISPKKTWAGMLGGIASAVGLSLALAWWRPELNGVALLVGPLSLALAGGLVAIVAQGGDLLESAAKRRVGVKDASGIIPGHGGVLDRCDGLLAASLVLAGLVWLLQAGA